MQRAKWNRRIVVDRTVEALLVGLCGAASIYGLAQMHNPLVPF